MKEKFFETDDGKPMGRIVLEDDCACVVTIVGPGEKTNGRGWSYGRVDKVGFALANCAEVAMNKMPYGARFATMTALIRTLNEKKLLPEDCELKMFREGKEVPLNVEALVGMLIAKAMEALEKGDKNESF